MTHCEECRMSSVGNCGKHGPRHVATLCLHLAAFGCGQCKESMRQLTQKKDDALKVLEKVARAVRATGYIGLDRYLLLEVERALGGFPEGQKCACTCHAEAFSACGCCSYLKGEAKEEK